MGSQGATARVPNFRVIPEKEFVLRLKLGYFKSAVRSRSFEIVKNKNGCILSSTGKVSLSFGFNDTI